MSRSVSRNAEAIGIRERRFRRTRPDLSLGMRESDHSAERIASVAVGYSADRSARAIARLTSAPYGSDQSSFSARPFSAAGQEGCGGLRFWEDVRENEFE